MAMAALALCLAAACERNTPPGPPQVMIRVAAASDLRFAFDRVAVAFVTKNPGIDVQTFYSASGTHAARIEKGEPYDLFLSADEQLSAWLVKSGHARDPVAYAQGHLVIWARNESVLDPVALGPRVLLEPAAKQIAIANPALALHGRAARAALKSLELSDRVNDRLVNANDVSLAAQLVESGKADAGIIALSLAMAPPMRAAGRFWRFPPASHPPIRHIAAIVSRTRHPEAARKLRDFLDTPEASRILAEFGYDPAGGPSP